jgi:tetratricopeptide (TPR) repeat protein
LVIFAATLSFAGASPGQSLDADFSVLAKARNVAAIESLARERLAKNRLDDVALWYWSRAATGDIKQREDLIARAEQCLQALPQSARCHSALGSLYGAMALSGGLGDIIKYAGRIKEMLRKAVELAPKNFEMRHDLNQFYLLAPGLAGGSVRKAIDNSSEFGRIDAARAQILRAEIHVYEQEYDRAEEILRAIQPGGDSELADAVSGAVSTMGFSMIQHDQAPRAQKLFEAQIAAMPNLAAAQFGLGRALLEQKQFAAAVAAIERALQIDPKMSVHYRLGIAYQGKGDKGRAMIAFQQFLSYQSQGKAADDARSRIEALKRG